MLVVELLDYHLLDSNVIKCVCQSHREVGFIYRPETPIRKSGDSRETVTDCIRSRSGTRIAIFIKDDTCLEPVSSADSLPEDWVVPLNENNVSVPCCMYNPVVFGIPDNFRRPCFPAIRISWVDV